MIDFPPAFRMRLRRVSWATLALTLIVAGGVAVLLATLRLPPLFVFLLAFIAGNLVLIAGYGLLLLWTLVVWANSRDASGAR
jgi:hypothetical protein